VPGDPDGKGAGLLGAGAWNMMCANRCTGAGSTFAAAVPYSPAMMAAMIPAARTGVLRATGRLRARAVARTRGAVTSAMNARMAAASPDSSGSVPDPAAALNISARAC
jgi:hypothetical protein